MDLGRAPVPSTYATENGWPIQRWPFLIENAYRSSDRTGGPAVRLPSVLYCPPWQGQPKPAIAIVGISVTSPTCFVCALSSGPFGCTGHPRCAQ